MDTLILPAPAKINLFLHITGQRPDGYHNLQTIFQFLDWGDTLSFRLRTDGKVTVAGNFGDLAPIDNIIYKAASSLQALCPSCPGISIEVDKQLPTGAGLGGGSSNAATTLIALNRLWGLQLAYEQLHALGRRLGADVPIFLYGQSAWAEGIGDIFTPMSPPTPRYILVIHQDKINTINIFRDPELTRDTPSLKIGSFQWGEGHNDFEPLVMKRFPRVWQTLKELEAYGNPRMTGSGSSIFMPVASLAQAQEVHQQLRGDLTTRICQGQNVSSLVIAAQAYGIDNAYWGVAKR